VHKSVGTYGSQSKVVTLEVFQLRCEYVTNVSIDLNAPNGVLTTKSTESGEDSILVRDSGFVLNAT
jgi:hypothetical protein